MRRDPRRGRRTGVGDDLAGLHAAVGHDRRGGHDQDGGLGHAETRQLGGDAAGGAHHGA